MSEDSYLGVLTCGSRLVTTKSVSTNEFKFRCKNLINDVFMSYKFYLINVSLVGVNETYTVQLKSFGG
jgi:hypothetical protein